MNGCFQVSARQCEISGKFMYTENRSRVYICNVNDKIEYKTTRKLFTGSMLWCRISKCLQCSVTVEMEKSYACEKHSGSVER